MTELLKKYVRSGHKRVQGWLLPGAVKMISAIGAVQERLQICGHVAEIGVHHGKLFILLYLHTRQNEWAAAIDLFERQDLNIDQSGHGDKDRLITNLQKHAGTDRVIIHAGDSTSLNGLALMDLVGGTPFRMISVDGGHTPEITAKDMATAEEALAEDGVVILDDCFNENWPGVSEGVHRHFQISRSIVPIATGGNKTLFSRPHMQPIYQKALERVATRSNLRPYLGSEVLCLGFSSPTFDDRISRIVQGIGRANAWKVIKDTAPARMMRHFYHDKLRG